MTRLSLQRDRRAAWAGIALAATGVLGQLAACGPAGDPPPPAPAVEEEPGSPLAELHSWGGMCAAGPCRTTLTVHEDGRWSWSDETGTVGGALGADDVVLLRTAVSRTTLSQVAEPDAAPGADIAPSTEAVTSARCEADFDGQSFRYGWASPAHGWQVVDSCEQHIDGEDPLVVHLDELAQRLAP